MGRCNAPARIGRDPERFRWREKERTAEGLSVFGMSVAAASQRAYQRLELNIRLLLRGLQLRDRSVQIIGAFF